MLRVLPILHALECTCRSLINLICWFEEIKRGDFIQIVTECFAELSFENVGVSMVTKERIERVLLAQLEN
jgi:hypothetical protein